MSGGWEMEGCRNWYWLLIDPNQSLKASNKISFLLRVSGVLGESFGTDI